MKSATALPPRIASRNLLWLRIGALLIAVMALVLILISYLNYSNYRKAYLGLNLTRYLVVAKDLRQTVVAGLNVGLVPAENVRLAPTIHELLQRESGIRFLSVLDVSGSVIGSPASPAQVAAWRGQLNNTAPDAYWQSGDADTLQIGVPFVNNFNLVAGAVIIGYDRLAIENATGDMKRRLALDVAAVVGVLAALTLAAVYLLTRRFSAELGSVGRSLDAALEGEPPHKVDAEFISGGEAQDLYDFSVLSQHAAAEIARLEWDLMRPAGGGKEGA
jgi:hypothetical protein